MAKKYVRVNDTLAKGLATRHLREVSEAIKEGASRAEQVKRTGTRLGPSYNYKVKQLQEKCKTVRISTNITGGKKDPERSFDILYWHSNGKELSIRLEGWKREKKAIYFMGPLILCTITHHFCARVYERLNTTELNRVEKELELCAYVIFQIHINNIEFQLITDGSVWVPTKNGLYIINKRDKSTPKVRTFISKEELKNDPKQNTYYNKCVSEKCLSIKYQRKNSNKREEIKIPIPKI